MARTDRAGRRGLGGSVGRAAAVLSVALFTVGCSGPLLSNPVPQARPTATPMATPGRVPDPLPVELPRDDGPHDRLTEWWYYTGHLATPEGRPFGFEFVIFRAERGRFPVAWASHLAITDEEGGRFLYAQRSEVGPQVDASPSGQGFDLAIRGDLVPGVPGPSEPWTMAGVMGRDSLRAPGARSADGTPFGLALELDAAGRAAVLHDGDGYVDFGPAGGSYYYSRTRMAAAGTLEINGLALPVEGMAWFDHQWGDFISVGGGGWDWFAINLDDGTDLTISLVRAVDGTYPLVYGTLVAPDRSVRHLARQDIDVQVTGEWTSPHTEAIWPSGWQVTLAGEELVMTLRPTLADQELDTRATTGVVYWEGSQVVSATRRGQILGGRAYVELTGYGPGIAEATPAG